VGDDFFTGAAAMSALAASGHVAKPIVGRCGQNIAIFDRHNTLVTETAGKLAARDMVYENSSRRRGSAGSTCSSAPSRSPAPACASATITTNSDILPLRVVPDAAL
jgi:glutathionylspermidine amidase/synthetase